MLEEQLRERENGLLQAENGLTEKTAELNEVKLMLEARHIQLEQAEKSLVEARQNAEQNVRVEAENMDKLKAENQSLVEQISLLQHELSKMGQDICVLRTQDVFKNSPKRGEASSAGFAGEASGEQNEASSNLLEINRYLRTQKDQLEEKCDTLNLNYEISQQRLKTIENELEFARKQSQMYESEVNQLKVIHLYELV